MTATILLFPLRGRFLPAYEPACDMCGTDEELVGVDLEPSPERRIRAWRCPECIDISMESEYAGR